MKYIIEARLSTTQRRWRAIDYASTVKDAERLVRQYAKEGYAEVRYVVQAGKS